MLQVDALLFEDVTQRTTYAFRERLVAAILGLVGLQVAVGLVEALTYHATASGAFASESQLRASSIGAFLAGSHYWGSAALLICSMGLIVEMVCNEGYRERARYFGALGLALCSFVFQLTGNVLPMDRHGVQTAVVEAGISGSAPVVGPDVSNLMLSGSKFSGNTLHLWWTGHAYLLPIAIIIAALLLWRPKLAPAWAFGLAAVPAIIAGAAIKAPLGSAATPADYGEFNARVSWYTWPLHSMLGAFSHFSPKLAWVGSIGVPTVLFAGLVALPWIGPKVTPIALRGLTLLVGTMFFVVGFMFGGPIASLTGNRDPAEAGAALQKKAKSTDPAVLALVAAGNQAFNKVGCADCHGRDGVKGVGGPDLSTKYLQHDEAYFERLIRSPKSVNPSATMPPFPNLSADQTKSIATYISEPR